MGRIVWHQQRSSGHRTSWARTVTAVVPGSSGARAFTGIYLEDGTETDIDDGTLVLQVAPTGSVKNGTEQALLFRAQGTELVQLEGEWDWRKQFLSLVDAMKRHLAHAAQQSVQPGMLTEDDRWTIINALRAAADTYEVDAKQCGEQRTREQFVRQAKEARELAERVEAGAGMEEQP